ncbi:MAG: hypothetical protein U5K54_08090 [Cytophagales bacterium]|nr:hypothetical protein [Cytophagales bacterium]
MDGSVYTANLINFSVREEAPAAAKQIPLLSKQVLNTWAYCYLTLKLINMHKIFILFIFISITAKATDPYPKNPAIDVIQYVFQLEVNDSTDVITGKTFVSIKFKKPTTEFQLDLINKDKSGKGMSVSSILIEGKKLTFNHSSNRLKITLLILSKKMRY